MVQNRIIFFATSVQPNPEEIDYWVDLSDNPYGGSIKYFNGTEWVRLAASGGMPDLSNYYTKTQVNKLLNDKANIGDVDSKVDDEEVKDVIKDIQFNTSNPNGITMVMFKYDGSNDSISLPIASTGSAGIVTSKDFLDFVKQHQLQELHTEMIDTFADIRAKYQKKLIAGLNIEIDQETNVISAFGDLAVQWDNIIDKPDFKPVATSGDYNDLINKLKPGKDVSISEDNVISIAIDSDSLEQSLATLQSNIDKEAATARAAETKLGNDIATEKNRAQSAEQTISTNLQNEINRSTQIDTQHTNAINKEVQDRKEAIATEVSDRNAAILVETNRAKAKEEELDNKITDHTTATNAALALKADKSDTYTKAQVDAKLSGAYKVKGSSTFEALPKDNNVVGDVYNITNAFNLGGKHYDAGTNVVWTEDGWDALSGSFDTTAIEGSIQEVADGLAQEILDRTQADTTINNNVSSLTNRVKVNEDKLTIINGNESTTGSIANAIKQAKSHTDTTVTAEQTRAEKAEQKLTSDLASEVTRAKGAESANTTAIANEVERATGVEETLNSNITQLQTQKVDKVEGKGLSTNDYTTPEKNKLAAIEAEANKYVLPAATASALGGVKIGSNITLADGGTISITKANVTRALGVDPTTTYVKKAGDTMTGSLFIETTSEINLYNTISVPSSRYAVLRLKSGDNYWDVTTKGTDGLLLQKQGASDVQLKLDTSGNVSIPGYFKSTVATGTAPIQVSSTTLCTNLNADMVDGKNVIENGTTSGLDFTKRYTNLADGQHQVWIKLATLQLPTDNLYGNKQIAFEIIGGNDIKHNTINYASLVASTRERVLVKLVMQQSVGVEFIAGYVTTSTNVEIWLGCLGGWNNTVTVTCKFSSNASDILTSGAVTTRPNNFVLGEIVTLDAPDWYGVSWSETSSSPDCTRIGNMDMHRTLPIQSMMKGYKVTTKQGNLSYMLRKLEDDWSKTIGGYYGSTHDNNFNGADTNIMVLIPEFWWIDDYSPSSKTHNLKICPHAKPGWNHHKEAFVGAYEGILTNNSFYSRKGVVPSVNVTREKLRTAARNNGNADEYKWNIYTYNEHRAICHLFLVEYATRNSQKAVNTELTPEGFRQGGLGSGCTTGTATINGAQTWSFIPTGSSDSLGSGSGEVTVTIQQTDQSGSNTSTITRKCNRYRGIENPFGHIWKHTDDIISKYIVSGKGYRSWSICENPINFSTNLTTKYTPICIEPVVTGCKTEIVITPTCDFFAHACTNGSKSTYWCDYNWDNTDTSEHCLLIGGYSDSGGGAGLFDLHSSNEVGTSAARIGSRLTYLPWAE